MGYLIGFVCGVIYLAIGVACNDSLAVLAGIINILLASAFAWLDYG